MYEVKKIYFKSEIHLLWSFVLIAGLIIFYEIIDIGQAKLGTYFYLIYLTQTIYHFIQGIPLLLQSIKLFIREQKEVPS